MKLACSSGSYEAAFRSGTLDLQGWLRLCADELELDGVEFVDRHFPTADPVYLRDIKKLCAELQLTIAAVAVTSDFARSDGRASELERVRRWCDAAAYLGAPVVRILAGAAPERPRDEGFVPRLLHRVLGPPKPNARRLWSDITFSLRDAADHAMERGVMLALQNRRADRLVGSAIALEQCVRDVGSPWLRICLDPADLGTRLGIEAAVTRTVLVQARMREVREDGSDAETHWPGLLQLLKLGRYRGFCVINYQGAEQPIDAVPRAARYLRGLMLLIARQHLLPERSTDGPAVADPDESVEARLRRFREQETPALR